MSLNFRRNDGDIGDQEPACPKKDYERECLPIRSNEGRGRTATCRFCGLTQSVQGWEEDGVVV